MRMIDLSSPVDAQGWEPETLSHEVITPAEGARHMAEEMSKHFGVEFDPEVLDDGELLSIDTLTLTTHTGTHIDAPAHYGTRASYREGPPRTIDELPLEWFHRPAVVLDLTDAEPGAVGADRIRSELDQLGRELNPLDIVLLHTGADQHAGTEKFFTHFTGLDGPATHLLLDLGVKVIGTDAFSLDAPFGDMLARYRDTGDRSVLWPAHFAGRDREFCQIERLAHLDRLPRDGFTLSCFPVKIAGAGAGWTRAVALIDEPDEPDAREESPA
ncbi:cyclase family protein [Streptomyces sp. 3MP-14]|uniref:Cyclase family protein n=1 Tax=Streptomyces mimosae TaxID=2586635 RepID=A0A5N6AM45_9ACTN|nr:MULTISPECIES: cyclase family protein [Streptomyces]KAB8169917.1 cyclase family protein [Streptomyces mimosae]KAB8178665.1 cyclase family protein [Streptomyces sp. 3MP-14]